MTWWAIDVRIAPERRERLGAWLVAHTGQAVEERDDGTLVTFAADERSAEALMAEVGAVGPPVETSRRPLDDVDWSLRWREGLGARRFGRLTVTPSWIPEAAAGRPLTVTVLTICVVLKVILSVPPQENRMVSLFAPKYIPVFVSVESLYAGADAELLNALNGMFVSA
jgi:hypothetical protein